jgi:hypothetical protein
MLMAVYDVMLGKLKPFITLDIGVSYVITGYGFSRPGIKN